jgi:1-aminocyclopropane-1-carboxylate deaminase/D-cysteine desulfhydrase-like pyridoxal-dependent ACC family enzyme
MGAAVVTTLKTERALFERLPRLADLVPFVALADGLPTPVQQVEDRLWVFRDDYTSSLYGGNKVRKLEFLLPIAERRGGPVVTAGGIGSHHVVAVATFAARLGLRTEAVLYPQPLTDDVRRVQAHLRLLGVNATAATHRYYMPAVLARRMAALALQRPYLVLPGASTPLGALGYVSAGLELVRAFADTGDAEPDAVVVPLGSGGTAVGLAIGLALGGWHNATVIGARAADALVTNRAVLTALEAGTSALVALGGWRPRPARWRVDGAWFGKGYGHPTAAGRAATAVASMWGIPLEPTYTAKGCAAALALAKSGQRVVYVHTWAGPNPQLSP